jgi:hypothetical protein
MAGHDSEVKVETGLDSALAGRAEIEVVQGEAFFP